MKEKHTFHLHLLLRHCLLTVCYDKRKWLLYGLQKKVEKNPVNIHDKYSCTWVSNIQVIRIKELITKSLDVYKNSPNKYHGNIHVPVYGGGEQNIHVDWYSFREENVSDEFKKDVLSCNTNSNNSFTNSFSYCSTLIWLSLLYLFVSKANCFFSRISICNHIRLSRIKD